VGSADRAALVRWDRVAGSGRIEGACGYRRVAAGLPVDGGSLVGTVCHEGLPRAWDDARLLGADAAVFCAAEPPRTLGSVGIVPIVGRDGVTAAVVLESETPGAIRTRDLRSVKLLAAMSGVSLDTLGDFEIAEREANTDQLTGLPNRRALEAQFGRALDRADRFGETLAVVVCDVDHFKRVNDSYGHEAGDDVLREVARTLQRGVRAVDLCVRFGGEEFMLLLPHTGPAGAVELAERLRRGVEARPVRASGRELHVTASFGIAVYPATVTTRDDLFAAADRALYQAKAEGRNCVRCPGATPALD
jgi:diguanylate cyclase (GGDEF)-like protein